MNAHDSEKVAGTLLSQGYSRVEEPADAGLVLYNTCSIRDKAEQKVFNRLQNFKRDAGKGKLFGVLGCVAQQEGEKIFDRAPHVSLVAGSASYTRLGEMLVQLEAGNRRVTGLSLDTEETFDTPFTRRVRYTTSHPRDFVKPIEDAMDANDVLCDHIHLPVQSGSTRVLAAMDRLYTRDEYMRRIEWIKNAKRRYSLTTDIIVGFPGETEEDFQQTLDLMDEVQYDSLFSFKYSPRPNTSAIAMEDRISEEEKQRRLVIVMERQRAIQIRRNVELVGG